MPIFVIFPKTNLWGTCAIRCVCVCVCVGGGGGGGGGGGVDVAYYQNPIFFSSFF